MKKITTPTRPRMKPNGIDKNISQGAAAAAQLPSFAGCGHPIEPMNPKTSGKNAITGPAHPIQHPICDVFTGSFGVLLVGGCSDILSPLRMQGSLVVIFSNDVNHFQVNCNESKSLFEDVRARFQLRACG